MNSQNFCKIKLLFKFTLSKCVYNKAQNKNDKFMYSNVIALSLSLSLSLSLFLSLSPSHKHFLTLNKEDSQTTLISSKNIDLAVLIESTSESIQASTLITLLLESFVFVDEAPSVAKCLVMSPQGDGCCIEVHARLQSITFVLSYVSM